jgi:N-acetylmuramoyl-L-alanine amidase
MKNFGRTAFLAALSFTSLIAIGGPLVSPAFGADDIIDNSAPTLLPDSVRETATQEGQTPVDVSTLEKRTLVPELRTGHTLAELVSVHAATVTSNREQECLAGAVYFESKGEPLDGQLAVAQVIQNRARSGRFAPSICGVVFQPSQFSFVRGRGFPHIDRNSRNWTSAVAIAKIAQGDLWKSSINNALYFHARRVSPNWNLTRIASIGQHVFYR